jgi:hypothetical protein
MKLCVGLDEAPCPNLMPQYGRRAGGFPGPAPVYCRLPNGRVRVPTRAELASLCSDGRYVNCPGYQRWARSWNASGGDS